MRIARVLLIFLAALAVVQTFYYYPDLPNTVASHFDWKGKPNGWMTKPSFFTIYLLLMLILLVCFLPLSKLLNKFPNSQISLPNKDYWLAPERKNETLSSINESVSWFGVATMLLMVYTFQLAIEANLTTTPILSSNIKWALLLYFIAAAIWLIMLYIRFRRPNQINKLN